jgi:predicted esterase
MLLLRPEVLAGAVLFHGQVTLEPDQRPDLSAIPIFLSGGRADPLIPPSGTEHLAALLRDAGAEVTLHWEPDGHALGRGELLAARRWLAEHVQSGVA